MTELQNLLRAEHAGLADDEVLGHPIGVLLGVDSLAAAALSRIGILTVFDLGSSWLFANASAIAESGSRRLTRASIQSVPSDWFKEGVDTGEADLGMLGLTSMRGVGEEEAAEIETALKVDTIRDFANWAPRRAARHLVAKAVGATQDIVDPAEALRPLFGQYPTERVYYNKLVMLGMSGGGETPLTGPISLTAAVKNSAGFKAPAVGALLTYAQSWYAQGVTLGHMLHSLALAPGEATRIAVIDWSRRTRATVSEEISETEQLNNSLNHARAISEVQNAVAQEFQEGGSISSGWSKSTSDATGGASSFSLGGLFGASDSSAHQESETRSTAESASWSIGSRSVMANLTQTVNDRTEQHANSVRNRRASAVREVSQSEHESVSTRVVANYNHMHALTVQYYEVVQIYQVVAELHQAERCLFLPFELPDFGGESAIVLVDRFRGQLLRAALNRRARDLLADPTANVELRALARRSAPDFDSEEALDEPPSLLAARGAKTTTARAASAAAQRGSSGMTAGGTTGPGADWSGDGAAMWDGATAMVAAYVTGKAPLRPGSNSLFLPDETQVVGFSFEGIKLASVEVERPGVAASANRFTFPNDLQHLDLTEPLRLTDCAGIYVTRITGEPAGSGNLTVHCSYRGRPLDATLFVHLSVSTGRQKVIALRTDEADRERELTQHLQANRQHYSQAIFSGLSTADIVMLLSEFTWNDRPLVDLVDPTPLAFAGNFIVFRAPIDDDESSGVMEGGANLAWGELLRRREILFGRTDKRLTPIPTAGVFAEAVLGRSNSAEKLDITRFWNWQDSPIPLQPTDIAPVATGSRGTTEDLQPGQLGQPVVNIVNPPAQPAPTGLGASLGVLANGGLFRDMGGLAGTQGLTQAASARTLSAATEAGQLATTNLQTEAQKLVAMAQVTADVAKAAMGIPPTGSTKGISTTGAQINHGRDMDERGVGNQAPSKAASGAVPAASAPESSVSAPTEQLPGNQYNTPFEARFADPSGTIAEKYLRQTGVRLDDAENTSTQGSNTATDPYDPEAQEVAEQRIKLYLNSGIEYVVQARTRAFALFRAWYVNYEKSSESASRSLAEALFKFVFETAIGIYIKAPSGLVGELLEGLAGKAPGFVVDAINTLGSNASDPKAIIDTIELQESKFIYELQALPEEYVAAGGTRHDAAVLAFIDDQKYDPGAPRLPPDAEVILTEDGMPQPTLESRERMMEETLKSMIAIVLAKVFVAGSGQQVSDFLGIDLDQHAEDLMLRTLALDNPAKYMERFCQNNRKLFGELMRDPMCI